MKINFKTYIAAALVALVLTSCTEEADVLDNKPIKNKKNMPSGDMYRTYGDYEEVDYTDTQIETMMTDFDLAINDYNVAMPEMSVSQSLFIMETFFNNAVVAKQEINEDAEFYEKQKFEFTLPVDNVGNIEGDLIRNGYRDFVDTVLARMNGHNLNIGDMYVKNITSNSVTFGLDIQPYNFLPFVHERYDLGREMKEAGQSIGVPSGVTSRWDNLPNFADEKVVHRYSFKPYFAMYTKFRQLGYEKEDYHPINIYSHNTQNAGDMVVWNSNQLNNDIIPNAVTKARGAFDDWKWLSNQVLVNYNPFVKIDRNQVKTENGQNVYYDKYELVFSYILIAEPSDLTFEELHYVNSAVVNRPINL